MKKRTLGFILASLLVVGGAIGIGVTAAYFNDIVSSQENEVTAGTFDIEGERDNGDWIPGPMFYKDEEAGLYPTGYWLPGSEHTRVYDMENVGSIDGKVTAVKASLSGDTSLAAVLEVQISDDVDFNNIIASGKLSEFTGNGKSTLPVLIPVEGVAQLWFKVNFPNGTPEHDNAFQGKNLSVDFAVYAQQQ